MRWHTEYPALFGFTGFSYPHFLSRVFRFLWCVGPLFHRGMSVTGRPNRTADLIASTLLVATTTTRFGATPARARASSERGPDLRRAPPGVSLQLLSRRRPPPPRASGATPHGTTPSGRRRGLFPWARLFLFERGGSISLVNSSVAFIWYGLRFSLLGCWIAATEPSGTADRKRIK